MENLDKLDKLLRQFPGNRAVFYAEKLGWSRSKVYDYLNSLQLRGKTYSQNHLWYPSTEERPSEIDYNRLEFLLEHGIVDSELFDALLCLKALEEVEPELEKDEKIQMLKRVVEVLCGLRGF